MKSQSSFILFKIMLFSSLAASYKLIEGTIWGIVFFAFLLSLYVLEIYLNRPRKVGDNCFLVVGTEEDVKEFYKITRRKKR